MARETVAYKQRKQRIRDDLERARGEMLKKFLNKRYSVDKDLMRMQPGNMYSGKTADDLIYELQQSAKVNALKKQDDVKKGAEHK